MEKYNCLTDETVIKLKKLFSEYEFKKILEIDEMYSYSNRDTVDKILSMIREETNREYPDTNKIRSFTEFFYAMNLSEREIKIEQNSLKSVVSYFDKISSNMSLDAFVCLIQTDLSSTNRFLNISKDVEGDINAIKILTLSNIIESIYMYFVNNSSKSLSIDTREKMLEIIDYIKEEAVDIESSNRLEAYFKSNECEYDIQMKNEEAIIRKLYKKIGK